MKFFFSKTNILFCLILVLSIFLRVYNISLNSLFLDEADVIANSTDSIYNTIKLTMFKHTTWPLFNIILYYWIHLVGKSEISVRMISTIFSILIIIFIFYISKKTLNKSGIIYSSIFLCCCAYDVEYSRFVGRYIMTGFFSLLSTWIFFRYLKTGKYFFFYILITLFLLFSHIFSLLIIFSHFFYYFFIIKRKTIHWIFYIIFIFLIFIISPFIFRRVYFFKNIDWWMTYFNGNDLIEVLTSPFKVYLFKTGWIFSYFIFFIFLISSFHILKRKIYSFEALTVFCSWICIISVFLTSTFIVKCYHAKNFFIIVPFYFYIISYYLSKLKYKRIINVFFILWIIFQSNFIYIHSFDKKFIPWREITEDFFNLSNKSECFYQHNSIDGHEQITIRYYLNKNIQIYFLKNELNIELIPDKYPAVIIREEKIPEFVKKMKKYGFELYKRIVYDDFGHICMLQFFKKERINGF